MIAAATSAAARNRVRREPLWVLSALNMRRPSEGDQMTCSRETHASLTRPMRGGEKVLQRLHAGVPDPRPPRGRGRARLAHSRRPEAAGAARAPALTRG